MNVAQSKDCRISRPARRIVSMLIMPLMAMAIVVVTPSRVFAIPGNVTLITTPAPANNDTGATPSTTLSWSHETVDSANRVLIVSAAIHRTAGVLPIVSGIVYDPDAGPPVALTLPPGSVGSSADGSKRTEIWFLVAPQIGTGTVTITFSAASNAVGASYGFASVDQAAPLFNSGANAASTASDVATVGCVTPTGFSNSAVVDVAACEASLTATPFTQLTPHDRTSNSGVPTDNLRGVGGAYDPPPFFNFFSAYQLSGNDFWSMSFVSLNPANVSSVGMISMDASQASAARLTSQSGGVLVDWRTGTESDNLGFRVHRERNGERVQVNKGIVAGSTLMSTQTISAGYRYSWFDQNGQPGDAYWIEDVDVQGKGSFHGPVVSASKGDVSAPVPSNSASLGELTSLNQLSRLIWSDTLAANGKGGAGGGGGGNVPGGAVTQFQLANSHAIKLGVRETGWYRISPAMLSTTGINLGSIDPRTIRLFNGGREVAIRVSGESDGRFDAGDAIEFYGTAIDSQATDTQVYWLTAGNGNGLRMKLQPTSSASGTAISYPAVAELKERFVYFASLENGERENFFGKVVSATPAEHTLTVSNIDPAGPNAIVEVSVQGVSLVPHRVTVLLNGQSIGEIAFIDKNAGFARITVPQSLLVEGANSVTLVTAADADPADVSLVDAIRIGYSHKANADQNLAVVNLNGRSGARTIDGFSNGQIRAFDVTNAAAVQEIAGVIARTANGYGITVQPSASARRLLVATPDRALVPTLITLNRPSTWNAGTNGANVVYITHRDFAASVAPLKALRESQGYSVAIVDVEDLYDEFSNGVESPAAIRAFVARARSSWSVKPSFVTFVGDGSLDPKNYLGAGDFSYVPSRLIDTTAIEMASDDWLVDGNGDDLPDVAVGRLPVRTVAEAQSLVAKIVAFESTGTSNRTAMLVSDQVDISDFNETTADIMALLPSDYVVDQINRGADTDLATRQAVQAGANTGPGIVNFVGHGTIDMWRGNLMNASDAGTLGNAGRLSVYVVGNCLNGYYQDPNLESLGEALLKAPNGAVAVWASSGATGPEGQRVLLDGFYRSLFAAPSVTIGQAAAQAKAGAAGDVRRSWVLLGDAATRLH